ncbi:hypothetical protein [Dactylosporangium darangshiense]
MTSIMHGAPAAGAMSGDPIGSLAMVAAALGVGLRNAWRRFRNR